MFFQPGKPSNAPSSLRLQPPVDLAKTAGFLQHWEAEHADVLARIESEILWWSEERARLHERHRVAAGQSYSMEQLYPARYHRVTEPRWWGNTHCGRRPDKPPAAAYLLQPDLTPTEWALFDLYAVLNKRATPRSILFSAISMLCTRRAAC